MVWDALESGLPPGGRVPPEGESHLWVARTGEHTMRRRELLDAADLADVGDASTSRVESDARTAVASRAVQRLVAAHYRGVDPRRVVIRRTCVHCGSRTHGRPYLVDGGELDFSVSHSGDWIVIAVVGVGRVGVDLEFHRLPDRIDDLSSAILSPAEAAEYRSLPGSDRSTWMYRTWVRKEAVIKLTGHGIDLDTMSRVDVREALADFSGSSDSPGLPREGPVRLRDLPAPRDYRAALASTREVHAVRVFQVRG
jgi:4'-phosphopantetheinyl transferase